MKMGQSELLSFTHNLSCFFLWLFSNIESKYAISLNMRSYLLSFEWFKPTSYFLLWTNQSSFHQVWRICVCKHYDDKVNRWIRCDISRYKFKLCHLFVSVCLWVFTMCINIYIAFACYLLEAEGGSILNDFDIVCDSRH